MSEAQKYATDILNRNRVLMEPIGFSPDWGDQPRRWKQYAGGVRYPLGQDVTDGEATVERGLYGDAATGGDLSLDALGTMLRYSYGLLGRRLAVSANPGADLWPYPNAIWHRGTASGGGLYPASVYLVAGAGADVPPGVYHYHPGHHALQQLLGGDVAGRVRAAVGGAGDADQFLIVGVKYWQNAFKYNSFSFHAVTMDVGTVVETWRFWCRAHGYDLSPELWFDETGLAGLLGLDNTDEGLFAVVPLSRRPVPGAAPIKTDFPEPSVRRRDREQSQKVIRFDAVTGMQRATASNSPDRPDADRLREAVRPPETPEHTLPLPDPVPLAAGATKTLIGRRSSFGRFTAGRPVTAAQLATGLRAALPTVGGTGAEAVPLGRLYVFVNNVAGVRPGTYRYDAAANALAPLKFGAPGPFLQRNYFLTNYNVDLCGAVVVPAIRVGAVLDAVGDRGYRLVNATIGATSQRFYLAATAMGLGAGVALGFDAASYHEELSLDATGETPLLIMMLGHDRPGIANFRYEMV